jgi:hypothetical protein
VYHVLLVDARESPYGSNDLPQFGLQLHGFDPLTKVGSELADRVVRAVDNNNTGLNAGVYFDYCSRKCLVTFQGTDTFSFADWAWTNSNQFFFGYSDQYNSAMEIGLWIHDKEIIDHVIFTGHSLGGGLASAATFFAVPGGYAHRTTVTFNAAYFREITGNNFINADPQLAARFATNFSNARTNILPYFVDGEVLTYFQKEILTDNWARLDTRTNGAEQNGGQILPRNWNIALEDIAYLLITPPAINWNCPNRISLHYMSSVMWGFEKSFGIRQ